MVAPLWQNPNNERGLLGGLHYSITNSLTIRNIVYYYDAHRRRKDLDLTQYPKKLHISRTTKHQQCSGASRIRHAVSNIS